MDIQGPVLQTLYGRFEHVPTHGLLCAAAVSDSWCGEVPRPGGTRPVACDIVVVVVVVTVVTVVVVAPIATEPPGEKSTCAGRRCGIDSVSACATSSTGGD